MKWVGAMMALSASLIVHVAATIFFQLDGEEQKNMPELSQSESAAIEAFADLDAKREAARALHVESEFDQLVQALEALSADLTPHKEFAAMRLNAVSNDLRAAFDDVAIEPDFGDIALVPSVPPIRPEIRDPNPPRPTKVGRVSDTSPAVSAPKPQAAPRPQPAVDTASIKRNIAGEIHAAIVRAVRAPRGVRSASAIVEVRFTGHRFAQAMVIQSSGDAQFDQAILRALRKARYPRLPEGLKGNEIFRLRIKVR